MIGNKEIQEFFNQVQSDENQKIAEVLFSEILSIGSEMCAAIKWKKLTFALNNDFHHWICAINFTKKGVTLYFHFGGLLNDYYNILIIGESKFLRKIEYKTKEEIDKNILKNYLLQAISKLDYFKINWKKINSEKSNIKR